MNQDVKEKWVAALRGGEYTQTTGRLRDRDSYCCLGVLCDLAVLDGAIDPPVLTEETCACCFPAWQYDESAGELPMRVQQWAGLTEGNPTVLYRGDTETLSTLNDLRGQNFEQIADVIEDQL